MVYTFRVAIRDGRNGLGHNGGGFGLVEEFRVLVDESEEVGIALTELHDNLPGVILIEVGHVLDDVRVGEMSPVHDLVRGFLVTVLAVGLSGTF